MKKCPKCDQFKQEEFFYRNIKTKDGLSYSCKECHIKYMNRRAIQNEDSINLLLTAANYLKKKV